MARRTPGRRAGGGVAVNAQWKEFRDAVKAARARIGDRPLWMPVAPWVVVAYAMKGEEWAGCVMPNGRIVEIVGDSPVPSGHLVAVRAIDGNSTAFSTAPRMLSPLTVFAAEVLEALR